MSLEKSESRSQFPAWITAVLSGLRVTRLDNRIKRGLSSFKAPRSSLLRRWSNVMRKCFEIEESCNRLADGLVKVVHGANDGIFNVAGETVANVQASIADVFNVPIEAFAYVNGKMVGEEHRLRAQDNLVFSLLDGWKGANDKPDDSGFEQVRTPFPYTGGKTRVAPEIWRRFGDVKNYIEPFFGGGAVLLNRPVWGESRIETVNDIDSLLVNFWRAVKHHPRKLAKAADYPVSELDLHARHTWLVKSREEIAEMLRENEAKCNLEVAAWWVWGISQWIGGGWCASSNQSRKMPHQHGRGVHRLSRQRPEMDGRGVHRTGELSRGDLLREYYSLLAARLDRVRILSGNWSRLVTPSLTTRFGITGVFLDPPYVQESGRHKNLYAMDDLEVGHQVRNWAVENGDNPNLRIALCGYEGDYIIPSNWSVFEWKGGGSRNGRKERIWFSPNCLR